MTKTTQNKREGLCCAGKDARERRGSASQSCWWWCSRSGGLRKAAKGERRCWTSLEVFLFDDCERTQVRNEKEE